MASFLTKSPLPMDRNLLLTTSTRAPATIISLRTCHDFQEVKQLHAQFVVSGLLGYHPLCARRLLEAYVTMSQIYYAFSIFERIPSPDVFVYNTMIRGLTMAPFEGKQVHCQIIKAGIVPDTHIHSSLIHMYTNSGSIDDAERVLGEFSEENTLAKNAMISGYLTEGRVDKARKMFDDMAAKDAASWSALITGYTKNGMHTEALALFQDMMVSHILPNEAALVSLLSACGQLGTLHQGRWIHAYIDKTRVLMSTKLTTALIDMYAKSGSIECGYGLFQKMARRDVVTWGVMISAFAIHGHASKCFQLFDEMLADGIRPNKVIFVAILSACSHAGCVEEGRQYFSQMEHGFGIKPSIEHYGCMVDLLGRAGLLADAEQLILSMPKQPNSIIWGSLLGACRTHNDLKRGTWAFENLMELEPTSGDRHKLAGLMFANAGEKEEAAKIRKMIHEKEMVTTCGSSFIEVEGAVHEFTVGYTVHNKARDI
ncbi:pentatricopeptide repeat-containing protein At5g66520 isoform X2 [Populus trichocarpa]|uniref:pentatricopeptide repeat-containing protein At5g66520 isoform X2 n=1 Tax=Populus trichocarpa TaxID=3694 RepID=UPI000D18AEFE|nr:pentatricopeptide repeat-containing protein At5g66520 isoform X2 [Populus trichocarpa]|eukprot:XP_024455759.1 pentatricopeptide repeat-containing protein At5g66520 isoform X3 [Populus trichocarpa]